MCFIILINIHYLIFNSSIELKEEYERLKEEQEKATEDSTYNFNKKRGINAEMKQFKKQKEEADNYKQLTKQLESIKVKYMLWKLYQMDKQIQELKDDIDSKNGQISEKSEEKVNLLLLLIYIFF